jgi:hypothetical protein
MPTAISYPVKFFRLFESNDSPHTYIVLKLFYSHRNGYRISATGFTVRPNRQGVTRRTSLRYDGGWMFQTFLSILPSTKFKQQKFDFLLTSINYGFFEKEIAELLELFCENNSQLAINKSNFLNLFHVYTGRAADILDIPSSY